MALPVTIKTYSNIPWNERELRRYANLKAPTVELEELLQKCKEEALEGISYKVCYLELPVVVESEQVDLSFTKIHSKDLAKNLADCHSVVVFGVTIGVEMDRLINRATILSPAKGILMHAVGVERIESLCDVFCQEIALSKRKCGMVTRPRFSPGYGDLDISIQKDIIDVLGASKSIGLALNESMLLSPSKSVTALIGISSTNGDEHKKSCDTCGRVDCEFRR
ncbi:MAG: Vitamin B12 dependent methionine synthase activation subunit [Clostridia bacterium]|nr:Vitamin B12 dependent methionine synthase activation subunit [Clostridia bacterium]